MHLIQAHDEHPARAVECGGADPVCVCAKGHVIDPSTGSCVKVSLCPCHHGHRSYNEGDSIKRDCNTWYVSPLMLHVVVIESFFYHETLGANLDK